MSPYCTNCGSEVEESWNICPNCGMDLKEKKIPQRQSEQKQGPQEPEPYRGKPDQRKYTSYGTIALICGLLGIIFSIFLFGPFFGIIAIITGGIGISKGENTALAVIGLVLGILAFVLFTVFFLILFSWLDWIWSWMP